MDSKGQDSADGMQKSGGDVTAPNEFELSLRLRVADSRPASPRLLSFWFCHAMLHQPPRGIDCQSGSVVMQTYERYSSITLFTKPRFASASGRPSASVVSGEANDTKLSQSEPSSRVSS